MARLQPLLEPEGSPILRAQPFSPTCYTLLAAVHDAGIVHRDIKPSNLLIDTQTNQIKLADFGLAYLADEGRMTRTGEVFGTPAYMAPEQARTTRVDARADLYSLALVFYESLTGTLPGGEAGMMAPVARAGRPLPWPVAPSGRPPIPPHVANAVMRTLEVEPENRPESARALATMLRAPSPSQPALDRAPTIRIGAESPSGTPRSVDDDNAEVTLLLVARIPPSMLSDQATRRWLASLTAGARTFTIGGLAWVHVSRLKPSAVEDRVASLTSHLTDRFGEIKLLHVVSGSQIVITPAMLAGGAELPAELQALVARLHP